MCKERGRDINASRMVYFLANGTWLQNVSLKYNSIQTWYAILTTILTFSMITNPGTCVLLNDDVNCTEYIVLVVHDSICMEILRREICSNATLASTNSTLIGMGLNLGLCGESPMSKTLSYGIAHPMTCNRLSKKMLPSARLNALNFSTKTHPRNSTTGHDWQTNWS